MELGTPIGAAMARELLPVVQNMDFAALARDLARDVNGCYTLEWPENVTLEWAMQHVYAVYRDDERSLLNLQRSLEGFGLRYKLDGLFNYSLLRGEFCGHEIGVSVRRKQGRTYQNGSLVTGSSIKLYYNSWSGHLRSILSRGLRAPWPSHGTEGIWAFVLPSASS